MTTLDSWSGGKDSCLAAHLAVERGVRLESLLCMREPGADRSRSHGLPAWLPARVCDRRYDADFLAALPPEVDACGEQGEFHTCVIAAPLFERRLDVRVAGLRSVRGEAPGAPDEYCFAELVRGGAA